MRTIFILADSTNRRCLEAYDGRHPALTPNLNRLADRSVIFNNHWCGSAPCMPARRDIMTGRLNFLDRPWGAIEPYDHTLQRILKDHGVFTHMVTDHYHYFEIGGENYHADFSSWNLIRGQEHDGYSLKPGQKGIRDNKPIAGHIGHVNNTHVDNTANLKGTDDYPSPQTFQSAVDWLEKNKDANHYMLWVEGFDPHEPFDVPQDYLDMYHDAYVGDVFSWPEYQESTHYTEEEIQHLQNRYRATLTMTDTYIGKIMDTLDRHEMWDDTMVIFTTDHGFMLGEHGFIGKNYMPDYNEVFHIPLLIWHPNQKVKKVNALTQNMDMFPTILDYFNVDLNVCRNKIHGKSLLPLLQGEVKSVREAVLYGCFGKTVNVTDGEYTYMRRAVREDNSPLSIYCGMPTILRQYLGYDTIQEEDYAKITLGHLSWTKFPVYKIPHDIIDWNNESQCFKTRNKYVTDHLLFNLQHDYEQQTPILDYLLQKKYQQLLIALMEEHDSPKEQFVRLGLT